MTTLERLYKEIDELRERSENYISSCEFEKSEQCLERIDSINSFIDKVWGEKYRG